MKFSEYTYERPDYAAYKEKAEAVIARLATAATGAEAATATETMTALMANLDTQSQLSQIRYSISTKDAFYEAEDQYWNEYNPLFTEIHTGYYRAVLASSHRQELEEVLPRTFFKMAQFQLDAFDPAVISLLQKENELSSAYQKLVASAKIAFDGKELNLSQLGPYQQDPKRETRKAAS